MSFCIGRKTHRRKISWIFWREMQLRMSKTSDTWFLQTRLFQQITSSPTKMWKVDHKNVIHSKSKQFNVTWRKMNVISNECGLKRLWSHMTVVLNECGRSQMNVVSNACGFKRMWSQMHVVSNECGLKWMWSQMTVVSNAEPDYRVGGPGAIFTGGPLWRNSWRHRL